MLLITQISAPDKRISAIIYFSAAFGFLAVALVCYKSLPFLVRSQFFSYLVYFSRDRICTYTVSLSQKFYRQQMLKLTAESPVPLEEANEEQPIASPVLAAALPPSSSGVTIGTSTSTNSASKRVRTFSGDMVASPVSYAPSNSWASRERDLNRPPPPPKSPPPTLSLDETTLSSKQQSVRPSITRQLSRQQSVAVFDDDGVLVPEPVRLLRSSVSRLLYL